MNRLIVTRWEDKVLTALLSEGRCRLLNLEPEEQDALIGNIYIGKVNHVVKNIDAAFVDLGSAKTGFYSLTENRKHLFTDSLSNLPAFLSEESRGPGGQSSKTARRIKSGDEIVVQVTRDAVKTKDPVVSCNLNMTGKYAVVTLGKTQIGFSAKLKDAAWKEELREYLSGLKEDWFGIIVRTNAGGISREIIGEEILLLKNRILSLLAKAASRTCYSLLEGAEPYYISVLRDTACGRLEAIITDEPACFERILQYLEENQKEDLDKLTLYEDRQLPLIKLCSLEASMEEAKSRRVWLKSGGYLVIEPTEALTVVDVNTGKYSGKKNARDTILKINLEAAVETARQLSLRSLSGIIIVDFIDMDREEDKKILLEQLEAELIKDPVKTVLVGMTKLGLVEITRKKVRRPFHEMIAP